MGNKSGGRGKYILFYLALGCITAALSLSGCAPLQDKIAAIRSHQQLDQYRENIAADAFAKVIQQCEQVLSQNETEPPADLALYALGEVYAHPDYSGRDYTLSQQYFEELMKNFPDSALASEAKIFTALFITIAAQEKAAAQQKALAATPKKAVAVVKEQKPAPAPRHRKIVENMDFAEAIQRNKQILEQAGMEKPADEALYNLGMIYAHVDNPAKDYKKAQIYFATLTREFPDSDLAEEARIWLGLFATIEKIQQIDIEIEQQKKQLIR